MNQNDLNSGGWIAKKNPLLFSLGCREEDRKKRTSPEKRDGGGGRRNTLALVAMNLKYWPSSTQQSIHNVDISLENFHSIYETSAVFACQFWQIPFEKCVVKTCRQISSSKSQKFCTLVISITYLDPFLLDNFFSWAASTKPCPGPRICSFWPLQQGEPHTLRGYKRGVVWRKEGCAGLRKKVKGKTSEAHLQYKLAHMDSLIGVFVSAHVLCPRLCLWGILKMSLLRVVLGGTCPCVFFWRHKSGLLVSGFVKVYHSRGQTHDLY